MNSLKVVKPRATIPAIWSRCSCQRVMQMWKV